MHSSNLESAVVEACKTMSEFHIPEDAQPESKIRKLFAGVWEAKVEVRRVSFELNMNITKFHLNL